MKINSFFFVISSRFSFLFYLFPFFFISFLFFFLFSSFGQESRYTLQNLGPRALSQDSSTSVWVMRVSFFLSIFSFLFLLVDWTEAVSYFFSKTSDEVEGNPYKHEGVKM